MEEVAGAKAIWVLFGKAAAIIGGPFLADYGMGKLVQVSIPASTPPAVSTASKVLGGQKQ